MCCFTSLKWAFNFFYKAIFTFQMKGILKNVAIEAGFGCNVMKRDLGLLGLFNFGSNDKMSFH